MALDIGLTQELQCPWLHKGKVLSFETIDEFSDHLKEYKATHSSMKFRDAHPDRLMTHIRSLPGRANARIVHTAPEGGDVSTGGRRGMMVSAAGGRRQRIQTEVGQMPTSDSKRLSGTGNVPQPAEITRERAQELVADPSKRKGVRELAAQAQATGQARKPRAQAQAQEPDRFADLEQNVASLTELVEKLLTQGQAPKAETPKASTRSTRPVTGGRTTRTASKASGRKVTRRTPPDNSSRLDSLAAKRAGEKFMGSNLYGHKAGQWGREEFAEYVEASGLAEFLPYRTKAGADADPGIFGSAEAWEVLSERFGRGGDLYGKLTDWEGRFDGAGGMMLRVAEFISGQRRTRDGYIVAIRKATGKPVTQEKELPLSNQYAAVRAMEVIAELEPDTWEEALEAYNTDEDDE